MDLRKLYFRTSNVLIRPLSEFDVIASEGLNIRQLNRSILLPFAILVALCALLGSLFTHIKSPLDSFVYVLLNAVIVLFIVLIQTNAAGHEVRTRPEPESTTANGQASGATWP